MDKNNNPFTNVRKIVAQAAAFILLFAVTLSCEKTEEPPQLSSETEILSVMVDGLIDTHIQVLTDPFTLEAIRVGFGGNHVSLRIVNLFVSSETDLATFHYCHPQFILSTGATIVRVVHGGWSFSPDSSQQMHFIITAEDGKTTSYVIVTAFHPQTTASTRSTAHFHISHSAGGSTNPAAGRHPLHSNQHPVSISALPYPTHRLRGWYVNRVRRSVDIHFNEMLAANDTVRAEFERIPPRTVTVQSDSPRMGTASSTVLPDGRTNIEAVPAQGHYFVGWYRNNERVAEWWGTIANVTFYHVPENITLVARFRPNTTFSGPTLVCLGSTFTMTNQFPPNATVTWTHSPNLQHTGGGTFRVANHGTTSWVQATVNGFLTRRHELWVGSPTIQSITQTLLNGPVILSSNIPSGSFLLFTVNHTGGTTVSWNVSPSHGVAMEPLSGNRLQAAFTLPGTYTISASVTNVCGTTTMSTSIVIAGGAPIVNCPFCGTPSNLPPGCWQCGITQPPVYLSDPDEEKKE